MKYLVVSDLHGSVYHYELIKHLFLEEKADKIIMLGDYAYFYGIDEECRTILSSLPVTPIAIEGNCDNGCGDIPEMDYQGRIYLTEDFSRTLCFTHGDRYNITNLPPVLQPGDVLCYGHTHTGGLALHKSVFIANCGSLSRPRHGSLPSYLVIDPTGIYLKSSENGQILENLSFSRQN